MLLSFSKRHYKLDDSPVLYCTRLCGSSYTNHRYLTYRLWTHVSDAIRMNDQVGELCLFTNILCTPRLALVSSEALESMNLDLVCFKTPLNYLLDKDEKCYLDNFWAFGLLCIFVTEQLSKQSVIIIA